MRMLLDLLIPLTCAGCGEPGTSWCSRCAATLVGLRAVERSATKGVPVLALTAYGGPARRAIIAYKERNRRALAEPLGRAMAAALPDLAERVPAVRAACPALVTLSGKSPPPLGVAHVGDPLWFVPAPSRRAAVRRRGGHHMAGVAEVVARVLVLGGVPARVAPVLSLAGRARDSVGLDVAGRRENLARHLCVSGRGVPPPGAPVLVLDDVVTTGSTAAACAGALRSAGLSVLAVLACAATV
ncbi:ComF family protein [Actinokineospora terrae]|uniref:Predicted amidophosphoribosyltransferases n=1 Tax=Actinokineospora terrae TaxID=155974 RepID=A0A1H9SGK0_9PSEU|nr:ComF family protein [Actinokineospora terrae]SER84102.1 Predicted amidophosphoribosyltransferases [Actinokineospora terrae]